MSERIGSEEFSRRKVLSLFGLAAALSIAVPATVLTPSQAEAQQTAPPPAGGTAAPGAPQTGTERRQGRRTRRVERRARRRQARQSGREERRRARQSGTKT